MLLSESEISYTPSPQHPPTPESTLWKVWGCASKSGRGGHSRSNSRKCTSRPVACEHSILGAISGSDAKTHKELHFSPISHNNWMGFSEKHPFPKDPFFQTRFLSLWGVVSTRARILTYFSPRRIDSMSCGWGVAKQNAKGTARSRADDEEDWRDMEATQEGRQGGITLTRGEQEEEEDLSKERDASQVSLKWRHPKGPGDIGYF